MSENCNFFLFSGGLLLFISRVMYNRRSIAIFSSGYRLQPHHCYYVQALNQFLRFPEGHGNLPSLLSCLLGSLTGVVHLIAVNYTLSIVTIIICLHDNQVASFCLLFIYYILYYFHWTCFLWQRKYNCNWGEREKKKVWRKWKIILSFSAK